MATSPGKPLFDDDDDDATQASQPGDLPPGCAGAGEPFGDDEQTQHSNPGDLPFVPADDGDKAPR